MQYPWQELVLAAFGAPAKALPEKIKAAKRAIAARRNDQRLPDAEELQALNDALNALRVLNREMNREQREEDTG